MQNKNKSWDITEISRENFEVLKSQYFTIIDVDYPPIQYYQLTEKEQACKILIARTDIGLRDISNTTIRESGYTIFCPANHCYVIDVLKRKIIFQKELNSPCIDLLEVGKFLYLICETEIIKLSLYQFDWISYDLTDAVEEILKRDNEWIILLYDGACFKISLDGIINKKTKINRQEIPNMGE